MKKLKEYNLDELRDLYDKNKEFARVVYERVYEESMDWQAEEFRLIGAKVFGYHDHYSSFYLTTPENGGVKVGYTVAHNLDEEYLSQDAIKLYDELNKLYDEWEETEDADACNLLENKMDDICDELAEKITEQLRTFENITDEDIWEELGQIADGEHYMSEWETDGTEVYEHITKTYK